MHFLNFEPSNKSINFETYTSIRHFQVRATTSMLMQTFEFPALTLQPVKYLLFYLCCLFPATHLAASDIREVLPLTRDIIMIHFHDGRVVYHENGSPRKNDRAIVAPLRTGLARMIGSYQVSSVDDNRYSRGLFALSVGLKSKGAEFTWMCQGWSAISGCINNDPDRVLEHWVYLVLPAPMKSGMTYTVNTGFLADNGNEWSFTFDEKITRSEAVHVNMIGYSTNAPVRYGYVYHWMGDMGGLDLSGFNDNSFHLVTTGSHNVAFSGKLTFRKSKTNAETGQVNETPNANFIGADVYECDFSAFSTPGEYVLSVEGIGCSFPFRIEPDIYREPFYTSIRGLYHNRSGIELKEPYTEFQRKAPHNPLITPGFAGKLRYTSSRFVDWKSGDSDPSDKTAIEEADKGPLNTWGWYQDAGDWDGYYTHLDIPCMLMFTWEAAPVNFRDNELNIPESGNGIPDILDEASWLLRFFYRTRHEIINLGYGTGGIGSRVFGDLWGGDEAPDGTGRGSWQDNTRSWYVSGEDPFTTYKYAALAAQLAFCLETSGLTDTIDWRTEAIESYNWAKANTRVGDEGLKPAIGRSLKDIRAFSASSLYRLTGDSRYHDQLISDVSAISSYSVLRDEARWAPFVYLNMPDSLPVDADLETRLRDAVIATADMAASTSAIRACRFGGDFYMPMLVGQATTPMVFEVIMAYRLVKKDNPSKASEYLSCLYTTSDYFLGCNPLNTSWITGLGLRRPNRVFHMDSWYNGKDEMVPGITPYGPWRDETTSTGMGPWDLKWPHESIYPVNINSWPGHERWFGNYTCPMNAEFTVHQNTVMNATLFGFLGAEAGTGFIPNRRPRVNFLSPGTVQADTVSLSVGATDPDGDSTIYKVEYYNGWHKIAESFSAPFTCTWHNTTGGYLRLTARVIDKLGMTGRTDTLVTGSATSNIPENTNATFTVTAYPNPFTSIVTFEYTLPGMSHVKLDIFDLSGRKMATLKSGYQGPASYRVTWDGTDSYRCSLGNGAYILRYEIIYGSTREASPGYLLIVKNN
jgi:hypothetical protein